VKRNSIFCLWTASTILSMALFAPTTLRAEGADEQDSLTVVEENYAYGTKAPSQRVKAFLKVAESKVQQVKKNVRKGSSADVSAPFSGYSTAIKGAWMGVSWGQALKTDMTESVQAIQRTTQKHVDTLRTLQATASPSQREALAQILSIVLRIQNSESTGLYARK
jgi:hypothetical protein